MGYYTDYSVRVTGIRNEEEADEIFEDFGDCNFYEYDEVIRDTELQIEIMDTIWYSWEEDCLKISQKYPRITIDIDAEGEKNGDLWRARVRNGECEVVQAIVTFKEFERLI